MSNSIELAHLGIGYKERGSVRFVGRNISCTAQSGRLTCLLGSNGVGKSTLLRTITGLQLPLEGTVYVSGHNLARMPRRQRARTVSVVLTRRPMVQNMTVAEVVGIGRTPYTGFLGMLGKHDEEIVCQALHLVGMEALAGRSVQTLSDGERQKMMIAKALAQQTPVIVLDEPTAFLDFVTKADVMTLLCRLCHDEGKTVLLSTHDVQIALETADDLWLMTNEGMTTGSVSALAGNGTLEAFIKRPNIAFDKDTMNIKIARV